MAENSSTLTLTLQIKDDGSVVVDTVKGKIDNLTDSTNKGSQSALSSLGQLKTGWLAVAGAAVGAYKTVEEFLNAASEAEQIESRMAFQLNQVGYNFQEIKPYIDEFADSILRTTRYSDEMARQGLGQMMQYMPDVEQAMQGVKLAMDMATQTGQDLGSTTRFVGMAMNGNAEILGRWIPELRDLDSKLGANATSAEKASYAIGILTKRFSGASQKDLNTYAGQVENLKNQFDELKKSAGRALMPLAQIGVQGAKGIADIINIMKGGNIPSYGEIAAQEEAKRKATEQARIATAAKAYEDDLAKWKGTQEQRQQMNFQFAMQEMALKKQTMALIDSEEFIALEKAKKIEADLGLVRNAFHLKRLEQIRKEKEEEFNAMQSLATMWKGYYDERISKENEIIGLIKGTGVETTIGAKFEFAGIEEQFRKISEKAGGMLTSEEFEKIKATYIEKLKGIMPFQGGEWEEISVPTGSEMGPRGPRTTWGTDWRWQEQMMTEQQRQVEAMRESSMERIQMMGKGITGAAPGDILGTFDQTRSKALELQRTIEEIKDQKLQIDTSRLIDAIKNIDEFEGKLLDLIKGDYKIKIGFEIVGGELIQRIEDALAGRIVKGQSNLPGAMNQ